MLSILHIEPESKMEKLKQMKLEISRRKIWTSSKWSECNDINQLLQSIIYKFGSEEQGEAGGG